MDGRTGPVGAVMGSKGVNVCVLDDFGAKTRVPLDRTGFNAVSKKFEENHLQLQLTIQPSLIRQFSGILQQGFAFRTRVGINIDAFLCDDLGLDRQYVKEKISTIFLDGKAVDSPETALLRDGSTLALSSAMPGLAGATLRRGGLYASLRSAITYRENAGNTAIKEGIITVKLFNLLINELGPLFLKNGIIIESFELLNFFARQGTDFRQGIDRILLDGIAVDYERLLWRNPLEEKGDVDLRVWTESTPLRLLSCE